MKSARLTLTISLALLTACKTPPAQTNSTATSAAPASAQATPGYNEALSYVKLMQIALLNVYYEQRQPIAATPCNNPMFGMRKPPKVISIESCAVKLNDQNDYLVAAKFTNGLAFMSDPQGTRPVNVSELPEIK